MKRALMFGLNEVSAEAYGGWQGWLKNPVNDARDTVAFYARAGFQAEAFFNLQADSGRLLGELNKASHDLVSGDTFLFYYSGHGGRSGAWTLSGYKETLCLADGELADTALREMFAKFAPGVRVVFISDSCHAGGMARTKPPSRDKPAFVKSNVSLPTEKEIPVAASIMLIAASQADELSSDGEGNNGAFTASLLQMGDDFLAANKQLTYDNHIEAVQRDMAKNFPAQHPVAVHYGAPANWNIEIA